MSSVSETHDYWFAAAVIPRHEKLVQRMLDYKGYKTSLPLRKTTRVRRSGSKWESELPLISGYVFVAGDPDNTFRVVSTPGVQRIIGFGNKASAIPAAEIEALERTAASPLSAAECAYLKPGQLVRLTDGPLKGIEGSVLRGPEGARFVVSIELLQRSVAVELECDWAEPVQEHLSARCA